MWGLSIGELVVGYAVYMAALAAYVDWDARKYVGKDRIAQGAE